MPLTFDFDNRMLFGVGQAVLPDGSLDKSMEYTNTNAYGFMTLLKINM